MRRHTPLHRIFLVMAAAGLFAIGYYWGNRYRHPPESHLSGVKLITAIQPPLQGLREAAGGTFDPGRLRGHLVLLALGPGDAPDGGPLLRRLVRIHNRLVERPRLQRRLLLLYGVLGGNAGAGRRLAEHLAPYGDRFVVLTAPQDSLQHIAAALGVKPGMKAAPIYLLDGSGQVVALFPAQEPVAAVAADVENYADTLE